MYTYFMTSIDNIFGDFFYFIRQGVQIAAELPRGNDRLDGIFLDDLLDILPEQALHLILILPDPLHALPEREGVRIIPFPQRIRQDMDRFLRQTGHLDVLLPRLIVEHDDEILQIQHRVRQIIDDAREIEEVVP